jgi:hypothetical protein
LCNFSGQVLGENKMVVRRAFAWLVVVCSCIATFAQIAGQNINMVSGTSWPAGDPFLQRQNEPSMAVSSRNPEHLLGGANDYRTVDIPSTKAPNILGDAWLGVYTSMDGGETWKSTLLPGYPQDTSSVGTSSPLHAFTVATDPTVRAGTNGMFYYSGLAFNRGSQAPSGVFVATFQDQNNKGNGDAAILATRNGVTHGNPFAYVGVNLVDSGTSGQFLDKPWIAVDIARPGRTATCKVNGRTFSSGYVYVVYTQFNGSQNNPSSKIKEVTSTNCGASWTMAQTLSQSQKLAQGTVAAIDPTTGNIYVAWRQIAVSGNQNQSDAIQWAVSTNGGASFTDEPAVHTFTAPTNNNAYPPGSVFDQPQANSTTFRSLDVPSLAVDGNGRVWLAYSQRFNGPNGTYSSRIMITTLPKGSMTWTPPYAADGSVAPGSTTTNTYGHQFMPSLNFAYGKLMLAWFDSRRDNLESVLQCASPPCSDLSQVTAVDVPLPGTAGTAGGVGGLGTTITNPAAIFTPTISDPNSGVRHTIDVFGSVINPSAAALPITFSAFQISQYPYYVDDANNQIEQGFFNPPNLPMFVDGTTPFMGDYIDIASQNILPSGGSWVFNTQATDATGATNAPDFHVTWTDNRDVVPPPVGSDGSQNWALYTPPNGGNAQTSTYTGTGSACPTCTTVQPACALVSVTMADGTPGTSSYTGDRNQNVYTSRISNGLVVRFTENSKPQPAGTQAPPQRSYSLLVKNTVSPLNTVPMLGAPSYYRILLGTTSTTQSASCGPSGASFPGTAACTLDAAVNPRSTLTQSIVLNSANASASVNVLVAQLACPANDSFTIASPGLVVCTDRNKNSVPATYASLQALAAINADPTNPSVADPDFLTTDNDNPDVAAPYANLPIAAGEEYDPTVEGPPNPIDNIFTPKISVPAVFTPKIGTEANSAPTIQTPTVFTPKITSIFTPKITSVQVANPTIVNTIFTPKIFTPKIFTPKIVSPDIFTPKITSLTDNSLTDYSWRVTNEGNTSASYSTSEFVKSAGVSCCPANCSANPNSCTVTGSNPAGPNCSVCQLVQHKVYETPASNRDGTNMNPTCDLTVQQQYITVANVPDPAFTSGTNGPGSISDPTSSTLSLAPGQGNRVTLRTVASPVSQTVSSFKTTASSLSPDQINGQSISAASLTISTSALPVAVVGQSYSASLSSFGGFGATAWSVPVDPSNPVAATLPILPEQIGLSTGITSNYVLNQSGQISVAAVSDAPGAYFPFNAQVQDSAATPSLDVQQLELDVNKFSISSVDIQPSPVENEVGGALYMQNGDTVTVAVTVTNQGPVNATMVSPSLTPHPTALVSCSGPDHNNDTILAGTNPVPDVFKFICTAGNGNGYVTFTANATGNYVNTAATVVATAVAVAPPTTDNLVGNVGIDNIAPTLTMSATTTHTSAPNWFNTPVAIPFATTDNLSGVMLTTAAPPAIGPGTPSGSMTLTTEGKLVTGSMTATDYSRNVSAPVTSLAYNIDRTPPLVTLTSPVSNAVYVNNHTIAATYNCSDPNPTIGNVNGILNGQQSGLFSCVGTYPIGSFSTTTPGNYLFTATGTDVAGNQTPITIAYMTAYYNFSGFQAPLAAAAGPGTPATPPSTPTNSGSFVAGTTIPILWTLTSPATASLGQAIVDPTTMTGLTAYPYGNPTCTGGIPTANPISLPAATYDGANLRFQSFWNTTSVTPGCYYVLIGFSDLSSYATNVTITSAGASNALSFDGTVGETVDGSNSNLPQGDTARTIEAWINPSGTQNGIIFNYGTSATPNEAFGLAYVNQHIYLIGESNDVAGGITIATGQWTHVAISYAGSGATPSLYVNGALDKGAVVSGAGNTFATSGSTWRIGDTVGTAAHEAFTGMIDEVKVWNTARTASQVGSDMSNALCVGQTGLVAYYKFNEGAAGGTNTGVTTLLDVSSSAANGTLNNFALSGNTSNWVQGDAPAMADDLSIGVSPANASLSLSGTNSQQFTASGSCTDGSMPTLTPTWSVNPVGFATVSSSGAVTGTAQGTTTVTAAYAGATGSAVVTVGP